MLSENTSNFRRCFDSQLRTVNLGDYIQSDGGGKDGGKGKRS